MIRDFPTPAQAGGAGTMLPGATAAPLLLRCRARQRRQRRPEVRLGLRRVLEPYRPARAPGQLLTLTNAGYLLRIEPGCLDVEVFRGLVGQARVARAAGDLAAAAAGSPGPTRCGGPRPWRP